MRASLVPVVLLAALTFFAGLGRGAITDSDEAFYAEAAREMVESGDWVTPYYNYEPRFQKPVLYYWLTAGAYAVAGTSEAAARFWAAMAGLGLALLTAVAARRWYDESTGLLAGAIAATSFGYFALGRMALPDLPLAFFITLAIWAAFVATLEREDRPSRWVLLSALGVGLGFLMKGPLGLIIPVMVVVPMLLIERRSLNLTGRDVLTGAAVFAVVALPWYLVMWYVHGTAYLESFFLADNFERFATDRFNDPRPWWFYLPIAAGGLLPWSPHLLLWVGPMLGALTRRRDVGAIETRLVFWAVVPLIFFTLSVGKQPRYILPILPPLAILLAATITERTRTWRGVGGGAFQPRRSGGLVFTCLLSGALLVTLAGLLYRAQPLFINVPPIFTWVAVGVVGVSGLLVMAVSASPAWRAAPWVLALAAALSFPAAQWGALSAPGEEPVQQMARLVRAHRTGAEVAGSYQVFVRNLVFYTGVRQVDLINEEQLRGFVGSPDRVLVVLPEHALDAFEAAGGPRLIRLGDVRYFNEAGLRLRTLLWPDPERDITRVVLAANR
ncbi:MAG: glycosyltransferase family 39 protein [Vicinamibacterales bacterium]|nr:glycosyltransferase family 39 protein [Vicinamibacterales bacterium]